MECFLDEHAPLKTSHRAFFPRDLSASNLMKRLNRIRLYHKPALLYKEKLLEAEKEVKLCTDGDRAVYLSKVFESRKTEAIFKHLRMVKSGPWLPSLIRFDSAEAESPLEKTSLFNDYFRSVYHSKGKWPLKTSSALALR